MTQFSVKTLILLLLAVLFISLLAQVRIELPLNEAGIPITGQTFAVLLVGALMGRNLAWRLLQRGVGAFCMALWRGLL